MQLDMQPSDMKREYEARVAEALQRYEHAVAVRLATGSRQTAWARFRLWLSAVRQRLELSLQPAEEGYIA